MVTKEMTKGEGCRLTLLGDNMRSDTYILHSCLCDIVSVCYTTAWKLHMINIYTRIWMKIYNIYLYTWKDHILDFQKLLLRILNPLNHDNSHIVVYINISVLACNPLLLTSPDGDKWVTWIDCCPIKIGCDQNVVSWAERLREGIYLTAITRLACHYSCNMFKPVN